MSKPIAVYAALTLALASSAPAYTYTCQEGHFQIDVPEGWDLNLNKNQDDLEITSTINKEYYFIDIAWGSIKGREGEMNDFKDYAYKESKDNYGGNIIELTGNDLSRINIEWGIVVYPGQPDNHPFIFSYLVSSDYVYRISACHGDRSTGVPEGIKNTAIKTLNSFRSLNIMKK